MSGIERLLERRRADAVIGLGENLAVAAQAKINVDQRVDRTRHVIGRHRRPDDGTKRGMLVGAAAQGDLVELLAVLVDAEQADMADMMMAARIDAAGDLDLELADLALARREREIGELKIKISGCINACGHHHVGHIGLLGVDKNGEEFYQITLGGSADQHAALGTIIGPAVPTDDVPRAIDTLVDVYLRLRSDGEIFPETYHRVGAAPFKEALYAAH